MSAAVGKHFLSQNISMSVWWQSQESEITVSIIAHMPLMAAAAECG
jgi:hypothetical protein